MMVLYILHVNNYWNDKISDITVPNKYMYFGNVYNIYSDDDDSIQTF